MKRVGGFSIIELLVTLAIIAVLASAAFPMMELVVQRGKERELRQALLQLRTALDAYKKASDTGHISKTTSESGYPPKLLDLVEGVTDAKNPLGPKLVFLRRIPRDPLDPDLKRKPEDTWGLRSYASPPSAPAEGADVFDVYSRADGNGLNGVPYKDW